MPWPTLAIVAIAIGLIAYWQQVSPPLSSSSCETKLERIKAILD